MKIAISSDHGGYYLKEHLAAYLQEAGEHDVLNLGVDTADEPSDYPDASKRVGTAINDGSADLGVVVCGSGVGACIAANKMKGIFACLCHDTYSAHQGVEHDRMNVLCLGERIIGTKLAEELVDAFLSASVDQAERHQRRHEKVLKMEAEQK